MDKIQLCEFLNLKQVNYEITEHQAVFSMSELNKIDLPYPESQARNLFLRDDKKEHYYLITVKGDKKVDLKDFKRKHNTRHLTFASPEDLFRLLKSTPGSVTPLGLLNDQDKKSEFYLDKAFFDGNGIIGCHPNDNTATVWIKSEDLTKLIQQHGTKINVVEI